MSLNLKCSSCGSSNSYVTAKEIICRKCGNRKRKYNSQVGIDKAQLNKKEKAIK